MIKALRSFIFILLLATAHVALGQTPVKQNLAGIATLDFPETPEVSNLPNGRGKFYKLAKPTHNYIAVAVNIDTAHVIIKSDKDLDLFYSGVVDGAADSTQNRKLVSVKQIPIGKYRAVEFKYTDASTATKFTVYQRIVYLDQVLFMYTFNVYDDTVAGMNAEREKFLNSFTVTRQNAKQL